ncbi:MAG: hypothetical protein K2L82_06010 [Lachnospiraceae bacterium]|nr:hypothetical protein [Lachnospiraceae bacterium]
MPSIKTNMLAWNANRQFNLTTKKIAKNAEKLSSGYKINRAADDAAGLAISEKMRRQIRGLHQGAENIQDGIGYVQTADGALNEAQAILQRMNELAVKSANGTNTKDDRAYINQEIQALKEELDRIFETTTFNEIRIWEPAARVVLGYEQKQAVEFSNTYHTIDVTNANCGVIAYGAYHVNADKDKGVNITWTGYDGDDYKTTYITWDELKEKNYRFEMSEYFGEKIADNKLYDDKGNAVFKHTVDFNPQSTATIDDMVKCIDGTTFYSSPSADTRARFEDKNGKEVTKPGTVYDGYSSSDYTYIGLNYEAVYASNHNAGQDSSTSKNVHNFDGADDDYIKPSKSDGASVAQTSLTTNLTTIPSDRTDLTKARDSAQKWEFTFYMDGIGKVTAVSDRVTYYAPSDTADDDYGYWWEWEGRYVNGKYEPHYRKVAKVHTSSEKGAGTLGSVMQALTGDKGTATPGLLKKSNQGDADNGGYLQLHFTLTAEKEYTYGNNQTSKSIGDFKIKFRVDSSDTEQKVLDKINNTLNTSTILDFYTDSGTSTYANASFGTAYAKRYQIDVPIYGGACNFFVQAGAEAGQHIDVTYDSLSLMKLGMSDTNVLTVKDSDNAINEIKAALETISEQRATFGAYQNRLEHAKKINENSEENTQYAESVIRDADIADEMMEYSINNILSQAGTSMLTQANQQSSTVLQLLQ